MVDFVPAPTALGTPLYLVVEFDGTEPYVMNLPDMLDTVRAFDQAKVYLITPAGEVTPVNVECTDGMGDPGDADHLDWEVTLADADTELVERIEFHPDDPSNVDAANWTKQVHGFNFH